MICHFRIGCNRNQTAMPKDLRLLNEITQAILANKIEDVKHLVHSRIKKKQKDRQTGFVLQCITEADEKLAKEIEWSVLAAASLKDTSILKFLIHSGLNVNFSGEMQMSIDSNRDKKLTPLHVAVRKGSYDTISFLLEANADVNKKDYAGRTPLHLAVRNTDCQATRMLLFRGAKAQYTDKKGLTVLQMAAKTGHVELVRILLEHDAQVFHQDQKGPSPLHIATMEGHVPLVDLFSRYADVNIKVECTPSGKQKAPIHLAAERAMSETVRFLVDRFCADVHVLDSDQQTPLQCLLLKKHDYKSMRRKEEFETTADFLLRKGVRVGQQNSQGDTALHMAARNQYHKIAEMLLVASADPHVKNKREDTPKNCIPEFDLPMKQIFRNCAAYSSPYIMRLREAPPLDEVPPRGLRSPPCTRVVPIGSKIPLVISSTQGKSNDAKESENSRKEPLLTYHHCSPKHGLTPVN